MRPPRVLSIAGSDPSGGAGIQADLKSIAANGGYGMAVITALTAQNTTGVEAIHVPPSGFLAQQLDAVSSDIEIDAVKIGMLFTEQVIHTVGCWLAEARPSIVVLDPVMVAASGARLLNPEAERALHELCGAADLVTPNLPELAVLTRTTEATSWAAARNQAQRLADTVGTNVLVKGGHLPGPEAPDALVEPGMLCPVAQFAAVRVPTENTHGTGCSLSAAVATQRCLTDSWAAAVGAAKDWLVAAIAAADILDVGHGPGPINHFAHLWQKAETLRLDAST